MKTKITWLLILFTVAAMMGLGCSSDKKAGTPVQSEQVDEQRELKIVTSFYPMYIMALNITKGISGVEVINMTEPVSGCLHDYQLTPRDMKNLQEAEIMIVNGAGMESFLDEIRDRRKNLKIVDASAGLELLEQTDGEVNPHLWVSVSGAIDQVNNITRQLTRLDPSRASSYLSNAATYVKQLEALKQRMHEKMDTIKIRDIITLHEAFPYFAQEFNLNIKAVIQHEPGSEPSAGALAKLIDETKESGVKVIFAESQYSSQSAEVLARETGAEIYYLDPAVSGPMEPDAYLKIMENNLKVLEEALK
ncbi:MAG: metal ABC transporter substrate-binding protein [Bacillota bacterium]|jgi:zinc transport system substrate-binding protein|nr:zinc ABC transporter substrate-binding protein [Clostridia bacterium]